MPSANFHVEQTITISIRHSSHLTEKSVKQVYLGMALKVCDAVEMRNSGGARVRESVTVTKEKSLCHSLPKPCI